MSAPNEIEAPVHGSEHSFEHHRPLTEEALRRLDPDLRLVLNKKLGYFQVMRLVNRPEKWTEPRLVWVADWLDGLERGDDPGPLIEFLKESDCGPEGQESSSILEKSRRRREEYEAKVEKHLAEEWRHATNENMRQLLKALDPFRNLTGFVR